MKIFITFEYFVPAFKAGGPIQSLDNMVKNLSGDDIEMFVCCSNNDLDGTILSVTPDSWQTYNDNTKVYYASADNTSVVDVLLKDIQPDIIFINGIFSKHFSITPLSYKGTGRKILSVRGMLHPGALSQKKFKKQVFLELFKLRGLHRKCEFHATSDEEAQYVKDNFGSNAKVWVVPNFPKIVGYLSPLQKVPGKLKMVSIALISPMKNIRLVIDALAQCTGDISYDIYGPVKDEQYWADCQISIKALPAHIKVTYNGAVAPDKVTEVLSNYHVMIQPSKSENFGHSIFEAFSAGKPVITSHNTPWGQLQENKAGHNVDIDGVSELRKRIEEMASFDNATYVTWTEQAFVYAMRKVDMPTIHAAYNEMFGIA